MTRELSSASLLSYSNITVVESLTGVHVYHRTFQLRCEPSKSCPPHPQPHPRPQPQLQQIRSGSDGHQDTPAALCLGQICHCRTYTGASLPGSFFGKSVSTIHSPLAHLTLSCSDVHPRTHLHTHPHICTRPCLALMSRAHSHPHPQVPHPRLLGCRVADSAMVLSIPMWAFVLANQCENFSH